MRLARRLLLVLGAFLVFGCAPAAAGDLDASRAQAMIERQLEAFARDDADGAYALAAPAIKELFPDPQKFIDMVRAQYAAVYRNRSVQFGAFSIEGDRASEKVAFVDNANAVWNALYQFARQPDGSWLISGCVVARSDDSAI